MTPERGETHSSHPESFRHNYSSFANRTGLTVGNPSVPIQALAEAAVSYLRYQDVFMLKLLRPHHRCGHLDSSGGHKPAQRVQMNTMETPDPVPDPLESCGEVSSSGHNHFLHLCKSARARSVCVTLDARVGTVPSRRAQVCFVRRHRWVCSSYPSDFSHL